MHTYARVYVSFIYVSEIRIPWFVTFFISLSAFVPNYFCRIYTRARVYTPMETMVDATHSNAEDNYKIVNKLPLSMRFSNSPVPLDLRLCQEDYLSIVLMSILTNVSRRTSLPKVILIAEQLTIRVSTWKHGFRLMYLVGSTRGNIDFLQKLWAIERHHSVRQVLFKEFQNLFLTKPSPETWSLYC